jgi:hypothetical protein
MAEAEGFGQVGGLREAQTKFKKTEPAGITPHLTSPSRGEEKMGRGPTKPN